MAKQEEPYLARLYPSSPKDVLVDLYLGKSLSDLPTPSAILDLAAVRRNCERMLSACSGLGLQWRAHVKTHKTAEITRLQVGDDPATPAQIVVSTLEEAEFLLPLLKEYHAQGRAVNVLYGLPIAPGRMARLAAIGDALGHGSISVLVDHPAQLEHLARFFGNQETAAHTVPRVYIKVDMGGRRAGVEVGSESFRAVTGAALAAHDAGAVVLAGMYSHASHSYGGDSRTTAVTMMTAELDALVKGADAVVQAAMARLSSQRRHLPPLVLSAGASPTALAVQNLLSSPQAAGLPSDLVSATTTLSALFQEIKSKGHFAEIHAGVYPLLDMQQLAVHSVSSALASWRDVAMTVLSEICSTYPGRGHDGKTSEALCGAGGLALGREFCKAYLGMAVVHPWGRKGADGKPLALPDCDVESFEGWIVGRFSQEHGILTWHAPDGQGSGKPDEFEIGQKVQLWPNHACITSSHFGWYFVIDSDLKGREDEVVDIYIKTRGW
ncbi:hypothetical protein RB593_008082 [Gaeumannomyces tritici]